MIRKIALHFLTALIAITFTYPVVAATKSEGGMVEEQGSIVKEPGRMVKVSGKLPQGVVVKKNKVMVNKNYTITRVSDTQATISARMNNNTTGTFDCGCSAGGGGCKLIIEGTSLSCVEGGGCTKGVCEMKVSIPSISVKTMQ